MHARFLKSTYKLVTSNYLIKNFTSRNQSSLVEYNCRLPTFRSLMIHHTEYRVHTQKDENDRQRERGNEGGEAERARKERSQTGQCVLILLTVSLNNLTQVRTEVLFTQCQIASSLLACKLLNNHNNINNWLIRFGGYLTKLLCMYIFKSPLYQ